MPKKSDWEYKIVLGIQQSRGLFFEVPRSAVISGLGIKPGELPETRTGPSRNY
ncbi:hypothetical protein BY996DRAFT_6514702 [Phakopsora pachyrhizi]|uniref:Uncharacterized protein n=1 Tax=Phakopsora pachyrhizi TaxID=170000 RepID=A0AAV0AT49_PHAPC|nr:hypothetical protein BY996DRAFT_6514702 [Phakopsora pachyrhizi]CAH7671727.1 hypothetical protein PPACK8108_LOCUS6536 [Phakopsora pachyrhizi]